MQGFIYEVGSKVLNVLKFLKISILQKGLYFQKGLHV